MDLRVFIILIILSVAVVFLAIISLFAYRVGLSDCSKLLKNEEILKPACNSEHIREPTEEEIIARNIENYCGDGRGQIEIEECRGNI